MPDRDLLAHVVRTTGLPATQAARVVDDVVAALAEPVEDLVRRRHNELQDLGLRNSEIFPKLAAELAGRVVAAPRLSERQLRRIVYG